MSNPRPSTQDDPFTERVIRRIAAGEPLFGERMFLVGTGPVPIPGAVSGAVALKADGRSLLLVFSQSPTPGTAAGIADYLDRMIQLGERTLVEIAGGDRSLEGIRREHAEFHQLPSHVPLNSSPAAVLLTSTEPPPEIWSELESELGADLEGVHVVDEQGVRALDRAPTTPEVRERARRAPGGWLAPNRLGVLGVVVGLGLTIAGAVVALRSGDEPSPFSAESTFLRSPIRTVATGTPISGTLAQWVGQQRTVTTSNGTLWLVYPTGDGLSIVADQANGGRSWRSSLAVGDVEAVSISVAIDADDRLHLVASDEQSIRYYELTRSRAGWNVEAELEIDPATTRQTVDIAWDEERRIAHVVWVAEDDAGTQPMWAAVSAADAPSVVETRELAPAGSTGVALVNVALLDQDRVITTYRRADRADGWYAQIAEDQTGAFEWAEEETIPGAGQIGAASLEVDELGGVHLALRDDSDTSIVYYRRTERNRWGGGVVVADGETSEAVDFPSLALDPRSKLVYLFYQTNVFVPGSTEVVVMIRDPVTGWEGPHRLAQDVPGGAVYPVTAAEPSAQPLVFWTALGAGPAIQMARVAAP